MLLPGPRGPWFHLGTPNGDEQLQATSPYRSKPLQQQSPLDKFRPMLENLFAGALEALVPPSHLPQGLSSLPH